MNDEIAERGSKPVVGDDPVLRVNVDAVDRGGAGLTGEARVVAVQQEILDGDVAGLHEDQVVQPAAKVLPPTAPAKLGMMVVALLPVCPAPLRVRGLEIVTFST